MNKLIQSGFFEDLIPFTEMIQLNSGCSGNDSWFDLTVRVTIPPFLKMNKDVIACLFKSYSMQYPAMGLIAFEGTFWDKDVSLHVYKLLHKK